MEFTTVQLNLLQKLKMRSFNIKISVAVFLLLFICKGSSANNNIAFDSANASYAKGNFEKAIELYESLVQSNSISFEVYFNLGNAYYKTNNIGLTILNYERAKKINPDDEDLITNLKLANQKTEDKIEAAPQLFLSEWKEGIINIFNEKDWSIICIILFSISLFLFALYILSYNNGLKKLGFFGGILFSLFTIFIFFIAKNKYDITKNSADAIVISATATITGSPNEKGTKLFILHEGTKVVVTQETDDWTEIKIANGNVGWIKTNYLQKI